MTAAKRLDWVDAAKGISILMVVLMYSTYSVGEDTSAVGFMHYVIGFTTPFRMPEFFLISGLFLATVIVRPFARYADRRVVHYFYFYLLWAAIHIAVKAGLGQGDPLLAASQLGLAIVEPYGVLWFIYMLGVFGLLARILWQIKAPHWLVLLVAAGLQMAPIVSQSYIVTQFATYFVYFYLGYAVAPFVFRFVEEVQAFPQLALVGLLAWALLNGALVFTGGSETLPDHTVMGYGALPGVHLLLGIAGAFAV
ncbi:MAG: acyltransferase family protein, partial [Cucumibacter sp.]